MQSYKAGKEAIRWFSEWVLPEKDGRILDLGCGDGVWARLIQKPCFKVGVDAVDYMAKYDLHKVYNRYIIKDVLEPGFLKSLGKFDIVFLGDLIEHLTKEEARYVLDTLEEFANHIIMSIRYKPKQKSLLPYDLIRQPDLTPEIAKQRYPEFDLYAHYEHPDGTPRYGYYLWVSYEFVTKRKSLI